MRPGQVRGPVVEPLSGSGGGVLYFDHIWQGDNLEADTGSGSVTTAGFTYGGKNFSSGDTFFQTGIVHPQYDLGDISMRLWVLTDISNTITFEWGADMDNDGDAMAALAVGNSFSTTASPTGGNYVVKVSATQTITPTGTKTVNSLLRVKGTCTAATGSFFLVGVQAWYGLSV